MYQSEKNSLNSSDYITFFETHFNQDQGKEVVIFIHDLQLYHKSFYQLATKIRETLKMSYVFIDFKGHGNSSGNRCSIHSFNDLDEDFSQILTKIRANIGDSVKIHIVSMGFGCLFSLNTLLHRNKKYKKLFKSIICINPMFILKSKKNTLREKFYSFFGDASSSLRTKPIYQLDKLTEDSRCTKNILEDELNSSFTDNGTIDEIHRVSARILRDSYFLNIPSLVLISKKNNQLPTRNMYLFFQAMKHEHVKVLNYDTCEHHLLYSNNRAVSDIISWLSRQ